MSATSATAAVFRDHIRLPESPAEVQDFLDEAYDRGTWAMAPPPATPDGRHLPVTTSPIGMVAAPPAKVGT